MDGRLHEHHPAAALVVARDVTSAAVMKRQLAMKTACGAGRTFRPCGREAECRYRAVQAVANSKYVCIRRHADGIEGVRGPEVIAANAACRPHGRGTDS